MDFKQLQSYIAIVKYKSFTIAAEKLGISQPTISTHIRILEEELDSQLVTRTAKNFEITPRGWELYDCAQSILSAWGFPPFPLPIFCRKFCQSLKSSTKTSVLL